MKIHTLILPYFCLESKTISYFVAYILYFCIFYGAPNRNRTCICSLGVSCSSIKLSGRAGAREYMQ